MILDEIVAHKKKELAALKKTKSLEMLRQEVNRLPKKQPVFLNALKKKTGIAVIAEIKKKSPSKGILRESFDPEEIALAYEGSGADALSVLTDEKFFAGSAEILKKVKAVSRLPVLRKDFTIDEYQVWEARSIGADAVLLIAAILSEHELGTLSATAQTLGLDVLFEVHTEEDVRKVLPLGPALAGINNRDLRTFEVDLKVTERLIGRFGSTTLLVSESGIQNSQDLIYLKDLGVKAVLVGESLIKEKNPGLALRKLLGR